MTTTTPERVGPGPAARSALPRADYEDAFRTSAPALRTAEQWARAAFEGGTRLDAVVAQALWRGILQLRLGSLGDPDRVAGWAIVDRAPSRLVLAASSWHLEARLVFEATPTDARVTTLLRYRNRAGRAVWATVGPVHRRAVPDILAAARTRLSR